jgi:hypothetical protein
MAKLSIDARPQMVKKLNKSRQGQEASYAAWARGGKSKLILPACGTLKIRKLWQDFRLAP